MQQVPAEPRQRIPSPLQRELVHQQHLHGHLCRASLAALKDAVRTFCEARDWDRFHGPRDLAIGVVTEAAELLDRFRFKDDHQCAALLADPAGREGIEHELVDTLFFILRFAQRNGIDLTGALERKLALNAERYPVAKARGSNRKYTEL